MSRPTVVERIARSGGIAAIHVTPFCNPSREVIGWQNVVRCVDGTLIGLARDDEQAIDAHTDYLRAAKGLPPLSHEQSR